MAVAASIIDTLAGGGGLITVPALLLLGSMNPVLVLGTNKLQSAIGEFSATLHFIKKKQAKYHLIIGGFVFTVIGSIVGTVLLQITPTQALEHIIPFLLLAVLIYYYLVVAKVRATLIKTTDKVEFSNKKFWPLGTLIGFYNGFFGPGTGSIWVIALMKVFKLDIKVATMYAKPLNLAGNLTALSIFIVGGNVKLLGCHYYGGRIVYRWKNRS